MNSESERPADEPAAGPSADRDRQLWALLQELLESPADVADECLRTQRQQYPELANELTELWATARIAEDFGSHSSFNDSSSGPTPGSNIGTLPDRIGDYELLEELGRGGMGVVFKARQLSLNRIVALKMILRGDLASALDVKRFHSEVQAGARLDHPNIVPVFDVGQHNGMPFFTMKFVSGQTLVERLADGPLTPNHAARLLLPIVHALHAAHDNGVLHRDLKASNILIDDDGVPYVTDFGLAKQLAADGTTRGADGSAMESLTQSGAIVGTPSYMAPEQAAGRSDAISPLADVYGLGCILYAMQTGRPPFQAATALDTLALVLEQDPMPPRLLNRNTNPELEMITLKCLQKPPDLRYSSARDLARDLEAFLTNEPISARSSKFAQVIARTFRETHHAGVLENWGLLWMWHSLVLLGICLTTNAVQLYGITSRWPYVGLWVMGLGFWAVIFWNLRRRAGPITFVERQIAHTWAGSIIASSLLFGVEALLELSVLQLSPVLGLVTGMVFLVKAGILSGAFYIQSMVLFGTAILMAVMRGPGEPDFSIALFGVVSATCFFVPGVKYYRQRKASLG